MNYVMNEHAQGVRKLMMLVLALSIAISIYAKPDTRIHHVHPLFWWEGMHDTELQILIHADGVADFAPSIEEGRGVKLMRSVSPGSPNYRLLYLDVSEAKAGTFRITMTKKGAKSMVINYELKARGAGSAERKGFTAEDVIYLIMPDRFANGNPDNDVVKGLREAKADRSEPFARHGGDMAGLTDRIDYLSDLGVTAVWLTPTLVNDMPAGSYHGYSATDLYETDPRLGSNEDYKRFVTKAGERGIKVVKDFVFNHCGLENFLYRDMPSPTWFSHDGKYEQTTHATISVFDPHAAQSDLDKSVLGWFVSSMPDFNGKNPDVATYLIQNSIWWIEYAGLSGIRQDTYPYNDFTLMAEWCKRIAREYPNFNIVGEAWLGSNVAVSMWQKDSRLAVPLNSHLPTVMDFPLMSIMNTAFDKPVEGSRGLWSIYEYLAQDAVFANPMNLLVFLDNHDTSRFSRTSDEASDTARYRAAMAFLLTTRGIPQLYYGDEVGMYADKSEGDGMLRRDFPGGWSGDAVSAFTVEGRGKLHYCHYDYVQRLLQWRKTSAAVGKGKLIQYAPTEGCYVYARAYGNEHVAVIINGKDEAVKIASQNYPEVILQRKAKEVISGQTLSVADTIALAPREAIILDYR